MKLLAIDPPGEFHIDRAPMCFHNDDVEACRVDFGHMQHLRRLGYPFWGCIFFVIHPMEPGINRGMFTK